MNVPAGADPNVEQGEKMPEQQSAAPNAPKEGRIARSWRLTRAAWKVVREDRSLLVLAGVSAVTGGIGLALIFILAGSFDNGHLKGDDLALFALILAYPLTLI